MLQVSIIGSILEPVLVFIAITATLNRKVNSICHTPSSKRKNICSKLPIETINSSTKYYAEGFQVNNINTKTKSPAFTVLPLLLTLNASRKTFCTFIYYFHF